MKTLKISLLAALTIMMALAAGCQPWQKKYETCQATLDNCEELYEGLQLDLQACSGDRDRLSSELAVARQELQDTKGQHDALVKEGGVWDPSKGTITVTLASDVLFSSGKTTLKSDNQAKLSRIANIIQQQYSSKDISVVGHTDTDPIKKSKWKDNWELSAQRALAVTRYMVSQGIPPKRLAAVGRGEFHPVATKAQSRRVEIIVHTF